jgi:peptidoglycan hydrolase-like protein with peptidoglycan-binding domain
MPNSYNGWSAAPGWSISGGQLASLVVAGEPFSPGVRAGDVHTVLQYVAEQLHRRVEPVVRADWHQADDWGYSYRANVNNPSQLSCHASGTAIDYNATRHPNGRRGTWTSAQLAEIARIFAEVSGVVRNIPYDEMHFEIFGNAAQVAAVAARLRGGVTPTNPPVSGVVYEPYKTGAVPGSRTLQMGSAGDDVKFVQRWHGLEQDGYFGPQTEAKVKATQTRNGLTVDGIVGPATFAVMGIGAAAPSRPKLPAPPRWDIPAGHYLGHIAGPVQSHGGGEALDRDNVLWWQRALIALGCVTGQTDPNSGWADGRWENPTSAATRIWFGRYHPGQQFMERCYSDDWTRMISVCRSKGLL